MAEKSERLKLIETIVEPQSAFLVHSNEINAQIYADNLPDGTPFEAKNSNNSNFRKLLRGLSKETGRLEAIIKEIADEHYIWTSTNLLSAWERSVGIPDDCFKIEGKDLDTRRRQVIAKMSLMNAYSRQDFIDFAKFFAVDIEITNCATHALFPLKFPIIFADSVKSAKYTMVVFILDDNPSGFPYTFPIKFTESKYQFLKCAIRKMAPSNVQVLFKYKPTS